MKIHVKEIILVGDTNDEETVDFVVGFSKKFNSKAFQRLFITTEEPDPVSFTVETLHGFNYNGTVSHNLTSVISLGHTYQVNSSNDRSKGIKIFARSKKIKVYGENYHRYTTDTFLALPCTRQNLEKYVYYGITFHYSSFSSQLLIVGCEDNTTVTVASQTITLNMMETYLYERDQDLTGTRVVSNNPISLFSGHQCTYIPENIPHCDHLTEQLPNTATWGTRFLTASLAGRNTDDMYRILASQPSTIVTVTCSTQLQSNIYNLSSAGDWETIVIPGSNSSYCAIESNNPLLLVQFSLGYDLDRIGDPFMMIVPAIEQYSNEVNIYITPDFSMNFITLYVAPSYYQPDMIYVDNISQENADWIAIYCADNAVCGYATYATLSVGNHQIYHMYILGRIGVSVYGFDPGNSYGYPGDLQLFPTHGDFHIASYTL